MNQCVISGHLGSDPAVFYSSEGVPVTTFSLAFRAGKDKTGWVKVVCFNCLAETAGKCLHKGAKVVIAAGLDQKQWETDGQKRTVIQLLAQSIEFIKTDGRGFDQGQELTNLPF